MAAPSAGGARPLCVDLDGTLLATDSLRELALALLRQRPLLALRAPLWLAGGRAALKARLTERVTLDPARLPLRPEVVEALHAARREGRRCVLVTAADRRLAESVAAHVGLFDEVLASDGARNLKGRRKAEALAARFGRGGFEYLGDSAADLPVWEAAGAASLVAASPRLRRRAAARVPIARELAAPAPRRSWPRWLAALALALAAFALAVQRSGDQPRLDAVAAAERELGIDLEARRLGVGEVELFVVEAGPPDGPLVVLLHGFPEFWYAWKGLLAPLAAAGFRVAAPDQRGYGDSAKPREVAAYRVERLAGDVAGLVPALGRESACVAAHDWGGGVAWQLALAHPERVRRLAILDTPHPLARERVASREETVSWYRTFFQLPFLPEWSARAGGWWLLSRSLRESARPGAFPEQKLALYRSAWDRDGAFGTMVNWYRAGFRYPWPELGDGRVRMPTLLLVAADDAFIASDLTRASAAFLERGSVVELGSGTHWVLQEEPARIAGLLADFCAP
jgi:pimeloyl-ACP methyl ester carboxylesterase/phosphoserine phosphatase